jgi:hypothetical protein
LRWGFVSNQFAKLIEMALCALLFTQTALRPGIDKFAGSDRHAATPDEGC